MNTTISIPVELRDRLKEWGNKGETYADIIAKLIEHSRERQLQELIMDTTGCIPIEQALAEAKKKWR